MDYEWIDNQLKKFQNFGKEVNMSKRHKQQTKRVLVQTPFSKSTLKLEHKNSRCKTICFFVALMFRCN